MLRRVDFVASIEELLPLAVGLVWVNVSKRNEIW